MAKRIGSVCDRICERWYKHAGQFGASGALAWVEGNRAALLIRGDTRAYHRSERGAEVVIREHVVGDIAPDASPEHASSGISAFAIYEAPKLPAPMELELRQDDRIVFVAGHALRLPAEHIEAVVIAHSLGVAAKELEQTALGSAARVAFVGHLSDTA